MIFCRKCGGTAPPGTVPGGALQAPGMGGMGAAPMMEAMGDKADGAISSTKDGFSSFF